MTATEEKSLIILRQIRVVRFGPFDDFTASLTPGLNAFIGPNASGKTQLLGAFMIALQGRKSRISINKGTSKTCEIILDLTYKRSDLRLHVKIEPSYANTPAFSRTVSCKPHDDALIAALERDLEGESISVIGESIAKDMSEKDAQSAASLLASFDKQGHWQDVFAENANGGYKLLSHSAAKALQLAQVLLRVQRGEVRGPVFLDNPFAFLGHWDQSVLGPTIERLAQFAQVVYTEVGIGTPVQLSPLRNVVALPVHTATRDAIAFFVGPLTSSSSVARRRSPAVRAWLAVATEWSSRHGGLSTLNRRLCIALAKAGERIVCFVPDADRGEIDDARRSGVELVAAPAELGCTPSERLRRRPDLPRNFRPTVIIGHGRITGPAARALNEDHYPEARRLHFVHMASDEIEWYKEDRSSYAAVVAEERRAIEIELGKTASCLVAIGPRLARRFQRDLSQTNVTVVRLDPGTEDRKSSTKPPPGGPHIVLTFGRMEDMGIKRPDLAARAAALAFGRGVDLELVVRGVPAETSGEARDSLLREGRDPRLPIVVRTYTENRKRLENDLESSSVVLMPSRAEGFGLVALEAIEAGVPVRVSKSSGLGELLFELLPPDMASRYVIPVTNVDDDDADVWSRAIESALYDRDAEFVAAANLRRFLSEKVSWSNAVSKLIEAVNATAPQYSRRGRA